MRRQRVPPVHFVVVAAAAASGARRKRENQPMNIASRFALAAAFLAAGAAAAAHDYRAGPIRIDHPWARPTVSGQGAGGGFMLLDNSKGGADRLLAASSPAAERVELHSMAMDGDVMRMRQIDAIDLPAGQTVALKPGGLHFMLIGLKRPLALGSRVPMKLRFEKAGEVSVEVVIENAPAAPDHSGHKH
jgi:copper(I)-binding protein